MNDNDKFFRLFGGIFFSVGVLLLIIAAVLFIGFTEFFGSGICLLLGIVFGSIGGGILIHVIKKAKEVKNIRKKGQKFTGKIYGYTEDRSMTVNGSFPVNIKVHYFDNGGIEREAIIPTGFTKGSGEYPIGATIDIIALGTSYTWDKDSVRFEYIDREEELMDDLPLDPSKIVMVAVTCPNCAASFQAHKGYVSKCPYCGSATNC